MGICYMYIDIENGDGNGDMNVYIDIEDEDEDKKRLTYSKYSKYPPSHAPCGCTALDLDV
jgi:hypothetical protein